MGYWVGREYWGQGIATEAATAIIGHGFDALGIGGVRGAHFVENPASGSVMRKCGFVPHGQPLPTMTCAARGGQALPVVRLQLQRTAWELLARRRQRLRQHQRGGGISTTVGGGGGRPQLAPEVRRLRQLRGWVGHPGTEETAVITMPSHHRSAASPGSSSHGDGGGGGSRRSATTIRTNSRQVASDLWVAGPRGRRPLPKGLVLLDSARGQQMLAEAEGTAAFEAMWPHFRSQSGSSCCGVCSTAIAASALLLPRPPPPPPPPPPRDHRCSHSYTEDDLFAMLPGDLKLSSGGDNGLTPQVATAGAVETAEVTVRSIGVTLAQVRA
eukprot:COSAG01_NODE_9149_length_2536_cov_382.367665_2_plen_327_part_00